MLDVLIWWLLLELIGIAVLPVAFRFFRNLPDRGYAFIKPLGLLLIAYPFWLLTSLGFLTNTRGTIVAVTIAVAAASWWFLGRNQSTVDSQLSTVTQHESRITNHESLIVWLRQNLSIVLTTELVFTVAYTVWVIMRAYMPEITATEKPMEFAFLNGVLQSEHFPPLDPWLSGYGISYYYFGYIIVEMLTMLSGVASSVAFNLAIATMFALGATGAFGLAYNLIRKSNFQLPTSNFQLLVYSLFAPVFLVLIGNLEGFFEALHAKGLGSPEFWNWLDVKGLADAPVTNTFVPTDNWWWWRASRVIHDVALGQTQEVIDEFPQFSFLLGDMHPHVLALPFVLLALAIALQILNSKFSIPPQTLIASEAKQSPTATEIASSRSFDSTPLRSVPLRTLLAMTKWNYQLPITNYQFLLLPLILGGLFFLNSWDILPYGFILVAAFAIARYRTSDSWDRTASRDLVIFVIALGALSIVMYLPFYIGFQSQAGGILPTLFVKTRLHQYLIIVGIFVFILGVFILCLANEQKLSMREWFNRAGVFLTAAISFPILVAVLALAVLALTPALHDQARATIPGGSDNLLVLLLSGYFAPWLRDPWLFVLLAVFLSALAILLRLRLTEPSMAFVLLIAFTGLLLTFGVEFVYLRDQFGTRMNTVFKFYFQTWTLLSIAGAYAAFYLSRTLNGIARAAWFVGLAILLGASLAYPTLAIPNRANGFQQSPTLNGIAWIRNINPSDYAVIQWLTANAPRGSTILEAPGGEYSYGNRISMATGLPTVLGWAGHESQWRGNSKFFKDDATGIDRAADVQRIYQTLDSKELLTLLGKYDIKFVVVGREEKSQYALSKSQIDKFGKVMALAFDTEDARVYAWAQ